MLQHDFFRGFVGFVFLGNAIDEVLIMIVAHLFASRHKHLTYNIQHSEGENNHNIGNYNRGSRSGELEACSTRNYAKE